MELSRFFHRVVFLGTDFALRLKGPDLHRRKDRSRVREEWLYKRVPATDAALIDHTADGFTIEEACRTCTSRMLLADIGAFVGSLTPDKLGDFI